MGVPAFGEHVQTFLASAVALVLIRLGFAGHQGPRDGLAVADLLRDLLHHEVAFVLRQIRGLTLQALQLGVAVMEMSGV